MHSFSFPLPPNLWVAFSYLIFSSSLCGYQGNYLIILLLVSKITQLAPRNRHTCTHSQAIWAWMTCSDHWSARERHSNFTFSLLPRQQSQITTASVEPAGKSTASSEHFWWVYWLIQGKKFLIFSSSLSCLHNCLTLFESKDIKWLVTFVPTFFPFSSSYKNNRQPFIDSRVAESIRTTDTRDIRVQRDDDEMEQKRVALATDAALGREGLWGGNEWVNGGMDQSVFNQSFVQVITW